MRDLHYPESKRQTHDDFFVAFHVQVPYQNHGKGDEDQVDHDVDGRGTI
jgi:hypothetical protein